MTATPPKPSLVKSTALSMAQSTTNRFNALVPTVPSDLSPITVYQPGNLGVGSQLNAPTSVFPAGAGYYGVWTAPDLNSGKPYTVQVECFGGGGGGGGGSATSGGGGGGGGEYACEQNYPVKPGQQYVWVIGVPGSPGTANNDNNQGATAGGTGGLTVFDVAGTGVAGGVQAHGGTGGDVGNTGLGGTGGSGSLNTIEFAGGLGGTNLPGGGGGSGGQGGTDNPIALSIAGLLSAPPQAWYILNDASSTGQLNDSTGNSNTAQPGSYAGGGLKYAQPGAATQVPAYTAGGNPPSSPNPTVAASQLKFVLAQLNQQSGYILCPGFPFSGSALTISGWVTPDPTGTWGNTAAGSVAMLACNNEIGSPGVALYFKQNGTASNPLWQLTWYCASSSSSHTVSATVSPLAGTPVYVVATFNSGVMTLYVNGVSAASSSASFTSVPSWPTVPYGLTLGADPKIFQNWFFGYMSNFWFADGVLSAAGVTQAFSGSGGSSTNGGAGGGASGGPSAAGGAGAAGSGSTGGAGGTPAVQPTADIGINTPASAGISGSAGGSGNSGITAASGAGGGGAGSSSSPPPIITVNVPFTTAAAYCGMDATGGTAVGPVSSTATSPGALAAVSPVLTFSQAGTYAINWTVTLAGTTGAADLNNFAVYLNGSAKLATSVNPIVAGSYAQAPFLVSVGAGDSLQVVSVGAGTTGAIYGAKLSGAAGAAGTVYNPVIQGTTGRLFTGGQAADQASGSKNSLLILPPGLAASLQNGVYTVLRVTLTVTNANPRATQSALMQVGWSGDTFLPVTYGASDITGSAGVVEIPLGATTVTADLTESQLGNYLQNGGAKALVLGPGNLPSFAAFNAPTAADFYTAIYGPGAADSAGNSLAPYLTITYAQSTAIQQGSAGGAGAILVTYLNQAQTLVGSWNATGGIEAQGGQLTETTVVLGSTLKNASPLRAPSVRASLDSGAIDDLLDDPVAMDRLSAALGKRLGVIPGAPGTLLGYASGTTTVTQTTPGNYTFTVPTGVTTLSVACWGAGAGATGGTTGQGQGAGGGGAYAGESAYAVTPGQVISYTVGAGGTGDHVGSNNSPDGGASIFDTTKLAGRGVTANGGQHYQGTLNYGPGGATAGNTVAFAGGNGGPLVAGQSNGSGGGGSAGSAGRGGNGSQGGGAGSAGAGGGAAGGAGHGSGVNGTSGSAPGAGGGGAGKGTSSLTGGNGGNGKVTITYVSSTVLNTSIATAAGTDAAGNAFPTGIMTNAAQVNGVATVSSQVLVAGVATSASVGGTSNHFTGNTQTDGTHSAGQVLVNGAVSSSQLAVSGSGHITSNFQVDGTHSASQVLAGGVSTGSSVGGTTAHFTSSVQADGGFIGSISGAVSTSNFNGAGLPQSTVSTVSSAGTSYSQGYENTLASAINGLISRLQGVGIIA